MKASVKKFCRLNGLNENSQNLVDIIYNAYIGSEADEYRGNKEEFDNSQNEEQVAVSARTARTV